MNWDDAGYLLVKNRYSENSVIAEFYTKNHGKCSGIIFGATSKKIKNYLLIGNKLHISYSSKNEDKVGYFKVEIVKANTPFFFEKKNKLLCISAAMHLIKLLTVENQKNSDIFDSIDQYFEILNHSNWIKKYIFWEFNLLKLIAMPLVLSSLITGVASLSDVKKLSRIGGKTIAIYIGTTAIAVTLGLASVNMLRPGDKIPDAKIFIRL